MKTVWHRCRNCSRPTLNSWAGVCPTCGRDEEVLARLLVPMKCVGRTAETTRWVPWVSTVPLRRYRGEQRKKADAERAARHQAAVRARVERRQRAEAEEAARVAAEEVEPTAEEIEAMIAEQMQCLPDWWERDAARQRRDVPVEVPSVNLGPAWRCNESLRQRTEELVHERK